MSARNAQLFEPAFERSNGEAWRRQRMELLQPQQSQRVVRRRREGLAYGMIAVLIFAAAFVYMSFEAKIGEAGRAVNLLQAQIDNVENESLKTELQIGELSALDRIESYAQIQLGMVYPDVKEMQYLDQQISAQIARDLLLMQPEAEAETETAPVLEERNALFAAWADWIGDYFSDTALAAEE